MHALNWWNGTNFLGSEVVSKILKLIRDDIFICGFHNDFAFQTFTNQDIFCFYLEQDLQYNMFVLANVYFCCVLC